MGCVAIGWPARSSAYRMNRTPFDGAPGTTAGSFASYWNVVAFHVYVVPNTTAGGKIDAAMVPLDGTSAARSAVAASRLSASERARPVTSVGWAAQQRPQGRHRARGSRHIRRGERKALERQGGEARTQRLDVGGGRERVGRFLRLKRVVAASGSEQRGGDGDVPQERTVTCWHATPPG